MSRNRSRITRRAVLVGGGLAGCCVVGGGGVIAVNLARTLTGSGNINTVGTLSLDTPLAIPPLAEATTGADGRITWDLTLQTGEARILPEVTTPTWGINGAFLAPTLRASRGDRVAPVLHNSLPESTTIHWHGMHLPARMDGGPHQMIDAGGSWEPEWTIDQPAATLWYHPHPHGETAEHVYRGIAGLFIVDDETLDGLHVPGDYGVDDVPLIIQDKAFDDDGNFDLNPASFMDSLGGQGAFGILGDTILINGTHNPVFDVTRSLTRFRLLNGSNARFYNLGFEDDRPFRLIALDNGFLPGGPVETTRLLLGPGERAEIVVAFDPGDDVILRSHEQDLDAVRPITGMIGGNDTFDLVRFRASTALEDSPPLEHPAGANPVPEVPRGATERTFVLNGHTSINGERMDMTRIDEVVPAGAVETWRVESDGQPHTFHIHGATFHVLEVEGEEPPPHLRGPKDTVLVSPRHAVRLAVQFDDETDPAFPYMYHCHILRHEDRGMMGQFVVVEPGTEASVPRTLAAGGHH